MIIQALWLNSESTPGLLKFEHSYQPQQSFTFQQGELDGSTLTAVDSSTYLRLWVQTHIKSTLFQTRFIALNNKDCLIGQAEEMSASSTGYGLNPSKDITVTSTTSMG